MRVQDAVAGLLALAKEPASKSASTFVTTAYRNGVSDEEIMSHTRHRSLTTMRSYVRRAKLTGSAPAGKVGL